MGSWLTNRINMFWYLLSSFYRRESGKKGGVLILPMEVIKRKKLTVLDCEDLRYRTIEIPFSSRREAEILFNSLIVDVEPTRKNIRKTLSLAGNILMVEITALDSRSLRIGVNSFLDLAVLSSETMKKFGPAQ